MPMLPINWSELDQKFWINDVDGEVLWFESSLDAKEAQLEVMLKKVVLDERAAIANWVVEEAARSYAMFPLEKAALIRTAELVQAGEHHK